ncbi:E3 ubiquitin-protein ligase COP1-like [Bradysia coprophila]|uniref:E3 ubiquitin-protein ligase COP1-like n=1 Tax=Bradysia coprophila TaxID=38358 RepID=UPI00187D7359|nr:E3 ubiquitin-protein ligase COP1-like [Bradysia coprophila]
MGYDMERFVGGAIESEFLCQICAAVLQDCVQTPCEHYFCLACINKWLALNKTCPADRRPLRTTDLREPCRLLRNVLARKAIKCDFAERGCKTVVKLENLSTHVSECIMNPNAEMNCTKGCNLRIKRRDQAADCFEHFNIKMQSQNLEISELSQLVNGHRAEKDKLKEEITKLEDTVSLQRQEIDSLDIGRFSRVRLLLTADSDIAWQYTENLKTNHIQGVLESNDKSKKAIAQLAHQLEPSRLGFSVCVLNNGSLIGMGLAGRSTTPRQTLDRDLLYVNSGTIFFNGSKAYSGEEWKEGDHIGCYVQFPTDGPSFLSATSIKGSISFYRNFECVTVLESVELLRMFPTVCIGN